MYLEYCRLAYRFFVPRKERSVSGEITCITGAGSGKRLTDHYDVMQIGPRIVPPFPCPIKIDVLFESRFTKVGTPLVGLHHVEGFFLGTF